MDKFLLREKIHSVINGMDIDDIQTFEEFFDFFIKMRNHIHSVSTVHYGELINGSIGEVYFYDDNVSFSLDVNTSNNTTEVVIFKQDDIHAVTRMYSKDCYYFLLYKEDEIIPVIFK